MERSQYIVNFDEAIKEWSSVQDIMEHITECVMREYVVVYTENLRKVKNILKKNSEHIRHNWAWDKWWSFQVIPFWNIWFSDKWTKRRNMASFSRGWEWETDWMGICWHQAVVGITNDKRYKNT